MINSLIYPFIHFPLNKQLMINSLIHSLIVSWLIYSLTHSFIISFVHYLSLWKNYSDHLKSYFTFMHKFHLGLKNFWLWISRFFAASNNFLFPLRAGENEMLLFFDLFAKYLRSATKFYPAGLAGTLSYLADLLEPEKPHFIGYHIA